MRTPSSPNPFIEAKLPMVPQFLQRAFLPLAVAATLALSGCDRPYKSDFFPYTSVDPVTDFGIAIQDLYATVTYVVLVIWAIVFAILGFVLVRFRDDGKGNPVQVHGNIAMEIGWTLLPVGVVFFLIVPTIRTVFEIGNSAPEGSLEIRVTGKRWWWAFDYLASGVTTANEMHIPDDRTVSLLLESDSVIHSFWIPRLGGKRDAVPGRVNRLWFNLTDEEAARITPGNPVEYLGVCAEYCGEAHALMQMNVIAHDGAEFDAWIEGMKNPAPVADATIKAKGEAAFTAGGCVGCHAITGLDAAKGVQGPNLTRFGTRQWLAAGTRHNKLEDLKQWIKDPNSVKPGSTAEANPSRILDGMNIPVKLTDEQVADLAAYLLALK